MSPCKYLGPPTSEAFLQSEGGHGVRAKIVDALIFSCFHHSLIHGGHVLLVNVQLPAELT